MERISCRIAAKDYAALSALLDDPASTDLDARDLIARKLAEADILVGSQPGEDVARIGSRVLFRINDSPVYERTLVLSSTAPLRAELPVTLPRGLALLGLAEGQSSEVPGADAFETVYLEAVFAAAGDGLPPPPRQAGAVIAFERRARRWQRPAPDDDPGPSAA